MPTIAWRFKEYVIAHHRYPENLDDLPERPGYSNSVNDGWRRPITFKIQDNGDVQLWSLGRDGKIGGEGLDADIKYDFRCPLSGPIVNNIATHEELERAIKKYSAHGATLDARP
jgi:hypothetical protein